MRYNTLSTLSTFLLSVLLSCTTTLPTPRLTPTECASRSDCRVVYVDNSANDASVTVSLNHVKLGDVQAYDRGTYTFFTSYLSNGTCATATAKSILTRSIVTSTEECIHEGQYYHIAIITHPHYIFLTPFNLPR